MPESNAQTFFRRFKASTNKAEFLRALVASNDPTFEDEWLDFKDGKPLEEDTAKIWSKSLSAFANTGGGILIFGVRCTPKKSTIDSSQKIDTANALALVPDPHALKTKLMQLHHQLTDPPLGGVEVESVIDGVSGGFVVCYIPDGPAKPYRAQHGQNYYIRVGDDNVIPPRSLLAQLFYPKRQVRVVIETTVSGSSDDRGNPNTQITLNVVNVGQSSLEDVMLVVSGSDDLERPLSRRYQHDVNYLQLTNGHACVLPHPLHPGQGRCFWELTSPGHATSRVKMEITINCMIYARDIEAHHAVLKLRRAELTSPIPTAAVAIPADVEWPL